MTQNRKRKGWVKEPARHSLAARGIRTGKKRKQTRTNKNITLRNLESKSIQIEPKNQITADEMRANIKAQLKAQNAPPGTLKETKDQFIIGGTQTFFKPKDVGDEGNIRVHSDYIEFFNNKVDMRIEKKNIKITPDGFETKNYKYKRLR